MSKQHVSLNRRASDHENRESSPPGYLSLREAEKWAGVSHRTIKRWFDRGLPYYQAGPREKVLVRQDDIDAFLRGKRVNGKAAVEVS